MIKGNSVFVDDQLRPYDDQWAHVSSIERLTPDETQSVLRRIYPTGDVINVKHSSSDYDESSDPWILPPSERLALEAITERFPQRVSINLANLVYIEKKDLPDIFVDRLLRLAAFQNPEFHKTQAMRLSTFGKPRIIACGEDLAQHIAMPRGLLQEVRALSSVVTTSPSMLPTIALQEGFWRLIFVATAVRHKQRQPRRWLPARMEFSARPRRLARRQLPRN